MSTCIPKHNCKHVIAYAESVDVSACPVCERDALAAELAQAREEIARLRGGLSKVATNIGNGSAASPDCSLGFLCDDVPGEVRLETYKLRTQLAAAEAMNGRLREALLEIRTNSKLRKRGGAGGRDSYAGMLGAIRVIDAALALPAVDARGKEGEK